MNENHEWPVNDIGDCVFSIPPYQRGYRWTPEEVVALLNDLLMFSDSSEETYCLQPLVFHAKEGGQIWVVDGQQRLTTLYIIMRTLGMNVGWDIKYTAENGQRLSYLMDHPGQSINDFFRDNAKREVQKWIVQDDSRGRLLCELLGGRTSKRVVFLRHETAIVEDGRDVFKRLNAGKTPLTSSELVRALFLEADNDLHPEDKADIAKEWDLIESAMGNETFWAIWNNQDFRNVPTRMDFIFSIVANVDSKKARHDGLLVYRKIESFTQSTRLEAAWEATLRCWWWMQACFADDDVYHLLGWLALFTEMPTRELWDYWQKEGCRMDAFKKKLRKLVAEKIGEKEFDAFRYDSARPNELRGFFVLINALEARRRHIRFRFDLYRKQMRKSGGHWDIEHIASRTDKPLSDKAVQEEWLNLSKQEMSVCEREELDQKISFDEKWEYVLSRFGKSDDSIEDKDKIDNLALLDAGTNRAYKNAIFPAKRRRILEKSLEKDGYMPPATEAVFAKLYSPAAAQMRYWGESDAANYREMMKKMFDQFMKEAK